MRTTRRALQAGAAVCCAAVLGTAPAAAGAGTARTQGQAEGHAGVRTVEVVARFAEPALQTDGVLCRPSRAAHDVGQTCMVRLVGPSTFTGTIAAAAALDYLVWPSGTKLRFTGVVRFTGSVEGCGTGSFVMEFPYGIVHMDRFDPATQSVPGRNTWVLRRGSGTGGLAGLVSGRGEVTFRAYPMKGRDGSDEFADGDTTGTFTCRVPRS